MPKIQVSILHKSTNFASKATGLSFLLIMKKKTNIEKKDMEMD